MSETLQWMDRTQLTTRFPFSELFPISSASLEAITQDMRTSKFDASKPIDVWRTNHEWIVMDGHTRLKAAEAADIQQVAVFEHTFEDEEAALNYAIRNQRNRRNLDDAAILACIQTMDKRRSERRGGDRRSGAAKKSKAPDGAFDASGKTADTLAQTLGISTRKVERARSVLDTSTPEQREAVMAGKRTINSVYNEIKKQPKERQTEEDQQRPETWQLDRGSLWRIDRGFQMMGTLGEQGYTLIAILSEDEPPLEKLKVALYTAHEMLEAALASTHSSEMSQNDNPGLHNEELFPQDQCDGREDS